VVVKESLQEAEQDAAMRYLIRDVAIDGDFEGKMHWLLRGPPT
jgi:hypothetical protein